MSTSVHNMKILSRIIDWFATPYSLWLVIRDPSISWQSKLKAGLILAGVCFYVLDPWDLIPDYIPFIGWIDDLMVIPLMMLVAGKVVPEVNFTQLRNQSRYTAKRVMVWTAVTISSIVLISLATLGLVIYLVVKAWS
jgi:uncharacterized membrane protein YkvA (DUF1232 family)